MGTLLGGEEKPRRPAPGQATPPKGGGGALAAEASPETQGQGAALWALGSWLASVYSVLARGSPFIPSLRLAWALALHFWAELHRG